MFHIKPPILSADSAAHLRQDTGALSSQDSTSCRPDSIRPPYIFAELLSAVSLSLLAGRKAYFHLVAEHESTTGNLSRKGFLARELAG